MHWGWWIFWVIFLAIAVWMISSSRSVRETAPSPRETPLDILKRRYASGEISTEEYEDRKARLKEPD